MTQENPYDIFGVSYTPSIKPVEPKANARQAADQAMEQEKAAVLQRIQERPLGSSKPSSVPDGQE